MDKAILNKYVSAGDYTGFARYLLEEVDRLENLLAVSYMTNHQMARKLAKAEHDRDRYRRRLNIYEKQS